MALNNEKEDILDKFNEEQTFSKQDMIIFNKLTEISSQLNTIHTELSKQSSDMNDFRIDVNAKFEKIEARAEKDKEKIYKEIEQLENKLDKNSTFIYKVTGALIVISIILSLLGKKIASLIFGG